MCQILTGKSEEQYVKDEITFLLHLLPPGTKLLSEEKRPEQNSLSLIHDIVFEHAMFMDGTVMEMEYVRECWPLPTGGLEHGNLFLGLRVHYYQPNNTEIGVYPQNPQL